ncbi:MAG: glycosyltransferase family 1 protein [Bryobacteraceae bacterium]|jgi:glycosyltransferase involved in cell wall biosynthesis
MIDTQADVRSIPQTALGKPRIGLVCDFVEENWPSMDLVASMVLEHLVREHPGTLEVTRICPPLQPRFRRLPGIGRVPAFHNADRLLNRFVDYRRYLKLRLEEFDLFHLVDHSYSQLIHDLPGGRAVVTCHDLDTFRCVLQPDRQPRPRWFRAMTDRVLSGFRQAAHVIAVSAATRDEILRLGLHPPERVTVISNGVHPSCSPLADPVADAEFRRLLPIDSSEGGWLLNVGSSMPRKRLDLLLRVLAEVRKKVANVRLLRVGEKLTPEQRQLARQLGVESAVVELGSLSRQALAAAYRWARLLVHTAEAEGFGLPLIEAMACGCQVIASDLPVLREVGGAAATYRAVGDIEGWRDAVVGALAVAEALAVADVLQERHFDREKAFANAARFSWSENAARTARVYEQVLSGNPNGRG